MVLNVRLICKLKKIMYSKIERKKYELPPEVLGEYELPPLNLKTSHFSLSTIDTGRKTHPSSFASGFGLRGSPVNIFFFLNQWASHVSLSPSLLPLTSLSLSKILSLLPHLKDDDGKAQGDEGGGGAWDSGRSSGRWRVEWAAAKRAPATTGAGDGSERSLGQRGQRSSGRRRGRHRTELRVAGEGDNGGMLGCRRVLAEGRRQACREGGGG